MLQVGPWCRLPLTVRWLDSDFFVDYSTNVFPPFHMPISHGKVVSKILKKKSPKNKHSPEKKQVTEAENPSIKLCSLCQFDIDTEDMVTCIKKNCHLMAHMICLAKIFTKNKYFLPIAGECPACKTSVLWGVLIRKKLGCNIHVKNDDSKFEDSDDENSDKS